MSEVVVIMVAVVVLLIGGVIAFFMLQGGGSPPPADDGTSNPVPAGPGPAQGPPQGPAQGPTQGPAPQPNPNDCKLSGWSTWSECSAGSCGSGHQTSHRNVIHPAATGGTCPDATSPERLKTKDCSKGACPIQCELNDDWSAWSPCTAGCNGGVQHATKSIKTQASENAPACPDSTSSERWQTRSCNTQACPLQPVTGHAIVCGQSGGNNCVSFNPCDVAKASNSCQNVKHTSPINLGSQGSKGTWPLSHGPYCQLSGFPAVPEGIQIKQYGADNDSCSSSDGMYGVVGEGGNCCAGNTNCTNTTAGVDSAKCDHPQWADGHSTGQTICSFGVEVLPGYTCDQGPNAQ